MTKPFVSFGEILWDVYPEYKKLGGAPFNVAAHLNVLGEEVQIISRIGMGAKGKEILERVDKLGISQEYIQHDKDFHSGFVRVTLDDAGSPSYEIVHPVAWDKIQLTSELKQLAKYSKAFIFGSLIARDAVSRQTLFDLLSVSEFNVFDVNLRQHYYSLELIEALFEKTHLLKMSDSELDWLVNQWQMEIPDAMARLIEKYPIKQVVLTKGANGASSFKEYKITDSPGYSITPKDSVGSGDAFLAAFLHKYFSRATTRECLQFACKMGALITTKEGAIPDYTLTELHNLK